MFYSKYIKRILDVLCAVILLILLLIPLSCISVAILINDGRPVIFKQLRTGQYGKPFYIYKFRTMVKNAESIGPKHTEANDTRITKVGAFLRKTSLDELPQIINILKGDMSFIGFRPGVYHDNVDYNIDKYCLKPGITGYAQVNGRSSLSIEEVEYWENQYVKDISVRTDFKIFLGTIKIVLLKKGVN